MLLLPCRFGCLLFLFVVWVLWLGFPVLCGITVVRGVIPSLSLTLEKNSQFLPIEDEMSCGFFIDDLYYVQVGWVSMYFAEGFYHEWMWHFVRWFSCICWKHHIVLILSSITVVHHVDWSVNVEPPLQPRSISQLIMVNDSINVLLTLVWMYFPENFCIHTHQAIGLQFYLKNFFNIFLNVYSFT